MQASRRCLYKGRAPAISVLGLTLSLTFGLEGGVLQLATISLETARKAHGLETGRQAGNQTRRDSDKQESRCSGRTLCPAGYLSLDRGHSPGVQHWSFQDCRL